jgi:hypothetical protein
MTKQNIYTIVGSKDGFVFILAYCYSGSIAYQVAQLLRPMYNEVLSYPGRKTEKDFRLVDGFILRAYKTANEVICNA